MGLSGLLHRLAARRPACYLVEAPGGHETRWALETALDGLGWPRVAAPGHADALLVAGELPEELAPAAEVLWAQLPGPRVRLGVSAPSDVDAALAGLPDALGRPDAHRRDATTRDDAHAWLEDRVDQQDDQDDQDDHAGHEQGHGDGGYSMSPSGIALAAGAGDRDGLEMDQLVHQWGPLLHHWPGGLEMCLTLRGDVVADASARWYGAPTPGPPGPRGAWDAVATTLALAGDDRHAQVARAVRDRAADDRDDRRAEALRRRLLALARRRSLPREAVDVLGELVGASSAGSAVGVDPVGLVTGLDLADARLLLAAHAPLLARHAPGPEVRDHPSEAGHDHG